MIPASTGSIPVYLEIGAKRSFAGALDWPGWCRGGKDEQAALQELLAYGSRYAQLLHAGGVQFQAPATLAAFEIVERLDGNPTTDFGAPNLAPAADATPLSADELQRLLRVLQACWHSFDTAIQAASGRELRKGPRGGGRDTQRIIEHVLGSDTSYLAQLGWKAPKLPESATTAQQLQQIRQAILQAVTASAAGEIAPIGPRGSVRWNARHFVRRVAWHVLDHAWEIENRLV